MSHRRAIFAARFLRPPGWTKRLILREKPRDLTGPYENPVRRWARLREKARLFSELPPPRKIPVPKPSRKVSLKAVEGVPSIDPAVLQRRLEFLLSPIATQQQLAEPLHPGISVYAAENKCWERQMRELRRIYRAQYLQKLAEVTEVERAHEMKLHQTAMEERKRRKQAHLHRVGEDMKRRAILKDRKRIEGKVNEAIEMAKRSKIKRRKLFFYRRIENLSKLIVSAENFDHVFGGEGGGGSSVAADSLSTPSGRRVGNRSSGIGGRDGLSDLVASGALLSRNVSVPFLLRQLGGAKGFPQQKTRRIPIVDNIHRDVMESSYDLMPEDEPRFEPPAPGPSARERASLLYSGFTSEEKMALLEQKLAAIETHIENIESKGGKPDHITLKLRDELRSAKMAPEAKASQELQKQKGLESRGRDPAGLPPPFSKGDAGV
eukprot:TRINITY_DN49333_c0_g1_i1.p1 TRINITY_DN49333_c0_g1~~TRINITY_DN49333_c0_g1_i1.p1  ORF type:complete len:464 (+),score=69.41 TRINITY_DN49333_c0_g1_i1:90-1394(+)